MPTTDWTKRNATPHSSTNSTARSHTRRGASAAAADPCPARILDRIATLRILLRRCEQRIKRGQEVDVWSLDSILAFQSMKALALPFELHPDWRDNWYP
ncbi:DUF6221 family protein [Streptomyces sp. MBT65]|uniref:DUF6221 family protein n=1 Tax=Streptomyces sp. MBT65 TaxID=1488395 RepID=UPI001F40BB6E|nr:DUF6221 family protein [Streptomyces sp. MBT65]